MARHDFFSPRSARRTRSRPEEFGQCRIFPAPQPLRILRDTNCRTRPLCTLGSLGTLATLAALLTAACFSDRPGPAAPMDGVECSVPVGAFGRERAAVLIRDQRFLPDTLRVRAGTTLTWINCEPAALEPHTVTAADLAWRSGLLGAGDRFERRFDAPGTHPWFCEPHPHMRGVVIVE